MPFRLLEVYWHFRRPSASILVRFEEAESSSDSLVHFCQTKWNHVTEDSSLHSGCHEDLKSHRITECAIILCDCVWECRWLDNGLMRGPFTFPNARYHWRWSTQTCTLVIQLKRWATILYLRVTWKGVKVTATRRPLWGGHFQYLFVLT